MSQVVLLRVGLDSGSGGMQGPLFSDGTFEFICIPDDTGLGPQTYGTQMGAHGRPWIDYFPIARRRDMSGKTVHLDPEFCTFTYGDPTPPKRSLRRLQPGDFLAFYCGLQHWDSQRGWLCSPPPALYLAGYFEVALAGIASQLTPTTLATDFANNFHVRHSQLLEKDREKLVLVKGGPGSRVFRHAYQISAPGRDRRGQPVHVLSPEMRRVFGDFTALNAIQRSTPRWVRSDCVGTAIRYLEGLE